MRYLRTVISSAFLAICAFALVVPVSCNSGKCKDITCQNGGSCKKGACECPTGYNGDLCENIAGPCDNIECLNGGECDNGICKCDPGYEGDECQTATQLKYIKRWHSSNVYYAYVNAGNSPVQLKIRNFANQFLNADVLATINGNTITIGTQNPDNTGKAVEGSGTLDQTTNTITWNYTMYTPPGQVQQYNETWNPQ